MKFKLGLAVMALLVLTVMAPLAARADLLSIGVAVNNASPGAAATLATSSNGIISVVNTAAGPFTINSISGSAAPVFANPNLYTNTIDVQSAGASTLYIYVTNQGAVNSTGFQEILSQFSSSAVTAGSTLTVNTYYSNTNQLYTGTLLASHTFTGPVTPATSGFAQLNGVNLTAPYSETVEYIFNAVGAASTNTTANLVAAPEPASLSLLGFGLAGLGALRKKLRK